MNMLIVEVSKLPDRWRSKSDGSAKALAVWFDNHLNKLGISTDLKEIVEDEDYSISFPGVQVYFNYKSYGSQIDVMIRDRTKDKVLALFWGLWKIAVDNDYIWGGPYRKQLTAETLPKDVEPPKPLPKTKGDLNYSAHQPVSDEARSILLTAFRKIRQKPKPPSAETFCKRRIITLMELLPESFSEAYVIAVFEIEKKDRGYSTLFEDLCVDDFVGPARLRQWDKEQKK